MSLRITADFTKAPDLYEEINKLNSDIINHKNGEKYGTKFLELFKRADKVINGLSADGKRTKREKPEQPDRFMAEYQQEPLYEVDRWIKTEKAV